MEATIFIAAVIAGMTESVKSLFPGHIHGIVTVLTALLVGVVVATLDTSMGIVDITVAEGITLALGTIGTVGVVKKIG